METLANLESFVRSAEAQSFSRAARRLALTPAAVSRNVAMLERNLGVRLFQRSTRKITLTEAGERLFASIGGNLEAMQAALRDIASRSREPAGVLKVSVAPSFGVDHLLPLLPAFLQRYPAIQPEWHFDNRPVDLIAEHYDAAIGGGFELSPGVVSRTLAPAHIIAVAAPSYLEGRLAPSDPSGLAALDGIVLRSLSSGRIRQWTLRDAGGAELPGALAETIVVNDPVAARAAARIGLGVALLAVPDVQPLIERGELVRLVPRWYADAGAISVYFASRVLPAKTRVFVDFVMSEFERRGLARRFAGSVGA
jgi:DNA-binding transcriptional LysR family regulator